jgi:hypothetical protein
MFFRALPSKLRTLLAGPRGWIFILAAVLAFGEILAFYARGWSQPYGLTRQLCIGREFDRRGIAPFRAAPKVAESRWGFDGQFYAELALDPLLRDPQIKFAIDTPQYRARRILLSWTAWLAGLGRPAWVLNAYAALNGVFWVGYAIILARLFRPLGWPGFAGFAAMLLTCGVVESIHRSLVDFPAFVLMMLAVVLGGRRGAGAMALAALARETSLLALPGLLEFGRPWRRALGENLRLAIISAVPLALWAAYVAWRLRIPAALDGGNMGWPMGGMAGTLEGIVGAARHGEIRWSRWFIDDHLHALLTLASLLTQCAFLLTHRFWHNGFWRMGAVYVPFFLCIGSATWVAHFTVTRHALPITLAFNFVLAARPGRSWPVWFVLGNCFVPFGILHLAWW